LSKDPEQRFATMGELGQALAGWLMAQGVFEDVSGVSLDSKWITRSSLPSATRASRASFASLTGIPPESGVRTAQVALGAAPTISLAISPVAVGTNPKPVRQGRIWIALVVFAAVIGGVALLAWKREGPALTQTAEAPSLRQPLTPVRPLAIAPSPAAATASPVNSSSPTPTAQPQSTTPKNPSRKAAPQPGKAQTGAGPTTRPPPSDAQRDLLAPY
jgi:serine/threonine-protein kinase